MKNYTDSYSMAFKICKKKKVKKIMLIGGTDVGKSHLIKDLARYLNKNYSTAIVDLDVGQSHIGPPTTVSWAPLKKSFSSWNDLKPKQFFFTGVVSPAKNLLRFISGAGLITETAASSCEKVLIDTTGLIGGNIGRILKQSLIDTIKPDIIIAIQNENELEHILRPYTKIKSMKVYYLKPAPGVRLKSLETRAKYRTILFKKYFHNNFLMELPLHRYPMVFLGRYEDLTEIVLKNRIVSLRDKRNRDRVLGIIESVNEKTITIRVKKHLPFYISYVTIGQERLSFEDQNF